ncbi:hypothetical protein MNBD_ALPHA09-2133 [hydrothermal vent metagenome]|uniref:Uncharacterized protein n=1 Tax=hydrothermal vent metagenome TaxID=652676 RepID=A0A3B0TBG6_9ZZZZ
MSAKNFTAIGALYVVVGAVALTAVATGALRAQGTSDRFLVTPIEGGIMRVDRQTGEVSVCKERQDSWNCELVPDDRLTLEREIDDLERDNDRLRWSDRYRRGEYRDYREKKRQAERRRKQQYDDLEDDPRDGGGVMSPEEVDKAMNTVERMMNRFMETARQIRRRMAEGDNPGSSNGN